MDIGTKFVYWYKRHWLHYRSRLLSGDYIRVAYTLSPDPKVQAHCIANMDPEDRFATERLLVKLFIPGFVEDEDKWEQEKARVVNKYLEEFDDFQNHRGFWKSKSIWIVAGQSDMPAHVWHHRYSYPFTEFLGKLACIVLSKVTGIGEAERHWKANKRVRSGQRARMSAEKTKKQAAISAAHSMEKSQRRRDASKWAGKLMNDEDFNALKLGEFLHFIVAFCVTCKVCANTFTSAGDYCDNDVQPRPRLAAREFRNWYEPWEKTLFKPGGNQYFAAIVDKKYGGISFKDFLTGKIGYTLKQGCAVLIRCRKNQKTGTELQAVDGHNWFYGLLVCYDGFDAEVP